MVIKRNLAIIPARSGSKGLADKNIKLVNGKPLLAYTIEAAMKSKLFNEIFVSTDSEKYAKIALEWGANVPFLRSDELATDTASSLDVVKDALKRYKEMGEEFDTVAILQPTSPLRSAEDIIAGYNKMIEKDANSIIAVCEVDHSPLWSNTLPEDTSLTNFLKQEVINLNRQSLPTYYRINGALYLIKSDFLMMTDNIYSEKSYALVMPKERSVDIDNELDLKIAEIIIRK